MEQAEASFFWRAVFLKTVTAGNPLEHSTGSMVMIGVNVGGLPNKLGKLNRLSSRIKF